MDFIKKYGLWFLIIALIAYLLYKNEQNKPGVEAGTYAPEFSFQALNGKTYNNATFKGKYVLIDFWGSWCFPCRAANAKLKYLYQEVQENEDYRQYFKLVSVGYEKDSTAWLNAIKEQKLTWPIHTMEKQNSRAPMTNSFKIEVFPTNFLLNPDGRIVGVNVSPTVVLNRLKM